ncbi:ATP-dependent RNA helicase MAK5 [Cryptococcus bacillisporus CA1873]|uniref:ATP-dependent RNA helicase n=1 Tax=Cryptococcus bacillisporus CA1873 TaxID=1296111 RepID=A0ABR5B740_CRYGA|nr:ATP-dependent RNA helicase MAK5 [Cryptococcus bacillisporus CA1873]|eukprot:KIR59411.1 ATP-dependent RNA helicase MAK5 [Cryptococcus gattii CA1873]
MAKIDKKTKLKPKKKSVGPSAKSTAEQKPKKYVAADSLTWKPVKTSSFSGIDGGGGMMMLEELEDVGIEWEEADGGRKVAKFVEVESKMSKGKKKAAQEEPEQEEQRDNEEASLESEYKEAEESDGKETATEDDGEEFPDFAGFAEEDLNAADEEEHPDSDDEPVFNDDLLPEWSSISLHPALKRFFLASSFTAPTAIQSRAIPAGITGRDVVGVAETGSGKTLAYALPILHYLLGQRKPRAGIRRPLSALVLCPTRELALQVMDHLNALLKHALATSDGGKPQGPPRISVGSVVGGLSAQKQKRILDRGCDVIVATPGRLWDLIKADDELATSVRTLRFLVIDEADRMIENGHFAELESIVKLTQRSTVKQGPDDDDPVFQAMATIFEESVARDDMQTFVFSATLSKDLQTNLTRRRSWKGKGKRSSTLEDLVEKLDFRDENPEVIDLSPEGGVVSSLRESMIESTKADKDLYLYYFLLRYPGRSIIFVNSIDSIRRLLPLFTLLQLPIFPLHSHLQQKQRLKNLDRFKSNPNGILIATDVAARGLDIPHVDHVVHFNLPRTADAYIHRSGRTARAQNEGFALQLVSPDEKSVQRALMKSLERTHELPDLSIEAGFLPSLRERLRVATEIEKAQHRATKATHDKNWLLEAAEAMDIDIDPSMLDGEDDDPDAPYYKPKKQDRSKGKASVENLKMELKALLQEKLVARGVSIRYPTSGSKVIVDDLIKSTGHGTLLGASTSKAYDQVEKTGKRKLGSGRSGVVKKKKVAAR